MKNEFKKILQIWINGLKDWILILKKIISLSNIEKIESKWLYLNQ